MNNQNQTTQNAKQVGTIIAISLIIIIALLVAPSFLKKEDPAVSNNLDAFAMCVAETEFTMYGAEWCLYCKKEREAFGSAWKYIPYVECPQNAQLCLSKGITGYPTWGSKDGTLYVGMQGLNRIAEITGCELPE